MFYFIVIKKLFISVISQLFCALNLLGVFKKYQCLAPTCSHSDSGMEFGGFKSPLDYANVQHSLAPSQMRFPQRAHKPP